MDAKRELSLKWVPVGKELPPTSPVLQDRTIEVLAAWKSRTTHQWEQAIAYYSYLRQQWHIIGEGWFDVPEYWMHLPPDPERLAEISHGLVEDFLRIV